MARSIVFFFGAALFSVGAIALGQFRMQQDGASQAASVLAPLTPSPRGMLEAKPVRLVFVGDVMLDRGVAKHAREVGDAKLFAGVASLFRGADLVVANHEGTMTTERSIAERNHAVLRFTFDPRFAPLLASLGIRMVSLSNNHTNDFGAAGYTTTKAYLAESGISTFGSPRNDDQLSASTTINGRHLCFVGYAAFTRPASAPIVEEIRRIRPSCDLLVATMHAGEEYNTGITDHQRQVAHAFVDAGADMVVGTHPHVLEPMEVYSGKAIFYSLGNALFDQDFSFATTHSAAVDVLWDGSTFRYTIVPLRIQGQEVVVASSSERAIILAPLTNPLLPSDVSRAILAGHAYTL